MRRLSLMSNNSVANEIDAIIARAMAEYRNARGVDDVFAAPAVPEDTTHSEPEQAPAHEEIPVNSQSALVSEETSRFSGALWFDNIQSKSIMLAGLGGIGSYVAFLLSRFHPQTIYLYDDDTVEAGNMSGQLYSSYDVGSSKVNAIADMISRYSNYYDVLTYAERFTESTSPANIMICGFDSMEARRTYYRSWKRWVESKPEEVKGKCLFIDGRLAAEQFQVLCIKGDDHHSMDRYEQEFLFLDGEAEETICSYKQTTFMANMIASVMVNLFVNFCANECNPLIPRDLPFFTEYVAETMYFKVVQ